ncbi:MAG TPA: hypothetical protein VNK06_09155 [Thermodesulfobacteriota bacterium]|nr:hypothetical protein [Thermodesulfobacteriota bacterium]
MNLGFNQNINYGGEVYHVQTEDGGTRNPVITTLLFKGGVIIASKRTEYSDIIKSDKLDTVVKDIMRQQHTEMRDKLLSGGFAQVKKADGEKT